MELITADTHWNISLSYTGTCMNIQNYQLSDICKLYQSSINLLVYSHVWPMYHLHNGQRSEWEWSGAPPDYLGRCSSTHANYQMVEINPVWSTTAFHIFISRDFFKAWQDFHLLARAVIQGLENWGSNCLPWLRKM